MTSRNPSKQTVFIYCTAFLLPILLYSSIVLCYHFGIGTIYPETFSYWRIPLLGLASTTFLWYLRHTAYFSLRYPVWQILFAISYGLSSCIITQERELLHVLVYALFPILFLTWEWMAADQKQFPFIIGAAALLLLDPAMAIPTTLLLYLLTLLDAAMNRQLPLGRFLHITGNVLFAFLIGSFRIIYYLIPYYTQHDIYGYDGFQITNSPAIFLSRFLPGSISSRQFFFSYYKIDLYCGLFVLAFALLFFWHREIASRKRISYGIFTLVLLAALELTPIQYVLNLFVTTEKNTIQYSFLLVFWILRLAAESCSRITQTTKHSIVVTMALLFLLTGISWCFGQHNFLNWVLIVHLVLLCVIGIVLWMTARKVSVSGKIAFLAVAAELCFNTVLLTNIQLKPANIANTAQFFYQQTLTDSSDSTVSQTANDTDTDELQDQITDAEYESYVSEHTDSNTTEILSALNSLNSLSDEEYREYSGKSLPNDFDKLNASCHKLGFEEDLFTPYEITITFTENSSWKVTDLGNQIYHITSPSEQNVLPGYLTYTIQAETKTSDPVFILDNASGNLIQLDEEQLQGNRDVYLAATVSDKYIPRSLNYQILCYSIHSEILEQLPALIREQSNQEKPSYLKYDIAGLILSYIGLMLLLGLLFYNQKEQVYTRLYQLRTTINQSPAARKLSHHITVNRLYYLAFLLPAVLILLIFIATDCMPFGSHTMFDEDGIGLVLPSYLDHYYNAQDGNTYLSMQSGYATNVYNGTPLIGFSGFYRFLSVSQVIILQQILLLLCIGFSGCAMVFYLTHRCDRPASKQDMRLLLPAIIYSMNAYMLRCHSFNTWYYIYILLPVLLIALQRLLYAKKWFLYTAALACCMMINIQLSLYLCIFLVCYFFTCHFDSIKDFLCKGVRFAFRSILAAGCSFFVIAATIVGSQQLYYNETDSVLPTLGLHGNFLTEWKNYMIYSPATFVSSYDGDLFAYCGILTLFLALVFFVSRGASRKEKLGKFFLIAFLCVSFNGRLLSYVWNGLHYQSSAPNRYTFLLLFLLAEIAYDGLLAIGTISRRTFTVMSLSVVTFFLCCQSYNGGNTTTAFITTMLLCVLYCILHLWYRNHPNPKHYTRILFSLALLELYSNGIYAGTGWMVTSEQTYGDYQQQAALYQEVLGEDADFYRSIYINDAIYNYGQMYHTYTNTAFNSYVSNYQTQLNQSYGFQSGSNYTASSYSSTQMGLALSATKYIFYNDYNTRPVPDLAQYHYLGYYNGYYVYENPYYLSLGVRVPESALHYNEIYDNVTYDLSAYYHNLLANEYLQTDQNLQAIHPIYYNPENAADDTDTFFFTDQDNNPLSLQEATEIYNSLETSDRYRLKMHITFSAPCEGYVYLYANELASIGYVHKGETLSVTIDSPNINDAFSTIYYMVVLKQDLFEEFYETASQNQLEDITVENDTITGTTNYDEDGYTMLSLPFDKSWHAYIDGEEVEIENPYNTGLYVKTPAGKHTLELRFIPYGMQTGKRITVAFWIITLLLWLGGQTVKRRRMS